MYFSCFAKKSTKRRRHREGAELIAPAIKATLPYVPIPARTWYPLEHLNGHNLLSGCGITVSGLFHDVRSADMHRDYTSGKKSEHFLSEQDLG